MKRHTPVTSEFRRWRQEAQEFRSSSVLVQFEASGPCETLYQENRRNFMNMNSLDRSPIILRGISLNNNEKIDDQGIGVNKNNNHDHDKKI